MEDINAKREARRRRILENSGKRLSKITGSNGDIKSEDTSSQTSFMYRGMQEEKSQKNINGTISEKHYDGITDTHVLESHNIFNSMNNSLQTEDVDNTLTPTRISPPSLPMNRINYIVLAFVVNILLALELDYLFGKSVVVPYFPLLMIRLYNRSLQAKPDAPLLVGFCILFHIKPKVTYQFKRFAILFYTMIEDLALYVFSFTMIYYTFFHCLYKTDTLTDLNL